MDDSPGIENAKNLGGITLSQLAHFGRVFWGCSGGVSREEPPSAAGRRAIYSIRLEGCAMRLWHRIGILSLAVGLSSVLLVPAGAQATPRTALLALSKRDHTLSIIDPASLQIVAQIPVGDDPHEVIASSDGRTAYVSNYGFGAFHTLAVIDLVNRKQMPFLDLGALRGPHGLAFVDGKVWFTAEAAKAIGSYDPAAGKIDWIMGTGQNRTHMIFVSSDQKRIITTNVSSGTVSIIDQTAPHMPGPPP